MWAERCVVVRCETWRTEEAWCGVTLCEAATTWCLADLWWTTLEVAADADETVKAATGRTSPNRANRCLREGITGSSEKERLRG